MKTHYQVRCFRALSILLLLVFAGAIVQAQSGRRGGSKSTTTAPTVSGAKEVAATPPKATRLQFLVGIDMAGATSNTPYYLADTVLDECIRRLGEAAEVLA